MVDARESVKTGRDQEAREVEKDLTGRDVDDLLHVPRGSLSQTRGSNQRHRLRVCGCWKGCRVRCPSSLLCPWSRFLLHITGLILHVSPRDVLRRSYSEQSRGLRGRASMREARQIVDLSIVHSTGGSIGSELPLNEFRRCSFAGLAVWQLAIWISDSALACSSGR